MEEEGGGAGRATKGGWKVRLAGGPTGRSLPAPSLALEPLPLFLPASAQREVREIWRLESSGFWGHGLQKWKGQCAQGAGTRRGRVVGPEGGTSRADCWSGSQHPAVGWWERADLPLTEPQGQGEWVCWGAGA